MSKFFLISKYPHLIFEQDDNKNCKEREESNREELREGEGCIATKMSAPTTKTTKKKQPKSKTNNTYVIVGMEMNSSEGITS